jgi:hypothetical protein
MDGNDLTTRASEPFCQHGDLGRFSTGFATFKRDQQSVHQVDGMGRIGTVNAR